MTKFKLYILETAPNKRPQSVCSNLFTLRPTVPTGLLRSESDEFGPSPINFHLYFCFLQYLDESMTPERDPCDPKLYHWNFDLGEPEDIEDL